MKYACGLFAVLVLAACSSSGSSSTTTSAPAVTTTTLSPAEIAANVQAAKNVKVTSCGPNGSHHVVIKGSVRNTSASAATYNVQLSINSKAGKRLYATAASAGNVAPGKTAGWSAVTSAPYETGMTCKVTSVSVRAS